MGGTIAAMGNTPSITAEWNIYCDPEAAHIVLGAFPEATMLSWETTVRHPFSWQQCAELLAIESTVARFFQAISESTLRFFEKSYPEAGYLLPDPLAMAIALEPALIKKVAPHYVAVELRGTNTRGQTVVDYSGRLGMSPNVQVVTEVDVDGVFDLFKRALA
jgi:purine nucleosidase